jgi:ABC-type glycerol-3-phosphate transport system permease component
MFFRRSFGDIVWTVFNYTLLSLLALACIFPFWWVAAASISNPEAVIAGKVFLWPVEFTLETYEYVLGYTQLWISYGNTLFYVVVGTTLNVLFTLLTAWPLSRTWFKGRRPFTAFLLVTMFFGGGMIPLFLVVRSIGLWNTRWAMILPSAIGIWEVIMARAYLSANIPDELVEAARIDGANDWDIFWLVVVPLAKPILAVITLFYAVYHWNDFFSALIFLSNQELYPLQVVLRQIVTAAQNQQMTGAATLSRRALVGSTLKYAAIMVATIPIMLVYPFIQKYFVKGALLGSLKG